MAQFSRQEQFSQAKWHWKLIIQDLRAHTQSTTDNENKENSVFTVLPHSHVVLKLSLIIIGTIRFRYRFYGRMDTERSWKHTIMHRSVRGGITVHKTAFSTRPRKRVACYLSEIVSAPGCLWSSFSAAVSTFSFRLFSADAYDVFALRLSPGRTLLSCFSVWAQSIPRTRWHRTALQIYWLLPL